MRVTSAGAGSGKTTTLCSVVCERIATGLDPAKILATTFTKKADAELKSRVLSKLLESGYLDRTDRLESAAIGTVHSIAHLLLSRYAIEMGLSPQLDVTEHGVDRILAQLLQAGDPQRWKRISELAGRFGNKNLTALIQDLMNLKRANQIADERFREQMRDHAKRIAELMLENQYAESDGNPNESGTDVLKNQAKNALEEIQALGDNQKNTQDAMNDLRAIMFGTCMFLGRLCRCQFNQSGKKIWSGCETG